MSAITASPRIPAHRATWVPVTPAVAPSLPRKARRSMGVSKVSASIRRSIDLPAPNNVGKFSLVASIVLAQMVSTAMGGLGAGAAVAATNPEGLNNQNTQTQSLAVSEAVSASSVARDDYTVVDPPKTTQTIDGLNVGTVSDNWFFQQFAKYAGDPVMSPAARMHNAAVIIAVGRQRGFSDHSIAIAVATSIQECNLADVHYGDNAINPDGTVADSVGLYQQQHWYGTFDQRINPAYAANKFYDGLAAIPNRDSMSMMDAGYLVQHPQYTAYAERWQWSELATQIVASYK